MKTLFFESPKREYFIITLVAENGARILADGVIGPAFAAFYNFATDFLPLANSLRLFRNRKN